MKPPNWIEVAPKSEWHVSEDGKSMVVPVSIRRFNLLLRSLRARFRVLICRHLWAVHLCDPPNGSPYLVICDKCDLGWGDE